MTEEEMYALEFSPEELCEEPSAEEPETEYHCPVCHASELQYAMHYRVSDDDETQELYRCAHCGATGEADDCRVEPVLRRRNPRRFTMAGTLYTAMRTAKIGKAELARRLNCHLPQVDRLLDLRHASRLDQLEAAFGALGKQLSVQVSEAA